MTSTMASSPQPSQVCETCSCENTAASHPRMGSLQFGRSSVNLDPSLIKDPLSDSPPSHRVLNTRLREEEVGPAQDLEMRQTSCKSPSTVASRLGYRYVALPRRARLCMATNLAADAIGQRLEDEYPYPNELVCLPGSGARITVIVL